MTTLLVTATGESTGKTAIAIALARYAQAQGRRVGYMKPKGTRLQSHVGKTLDRDPMLARELLGTDDEIHEMEPIVYSPTFVRSALEGRERPDELRARVRDGFDAVSEGREFVAVEGGGRFTTGGVVDLTDAEVADLLDADVVLVAEYESPPDVDETLAAARQLGDRLLGVVFNRVSGAAYDEVESVVAPFLEERGIPVVGVLPREPTLAGVTVAELASELGVETLTDVPTDGVVERFLVGAMSGESALRFFRRTKDAAVITGGDRTDIHTAALEAPGITGLVVTGGRRPPGPVLGKAAEKGVPVLLSAADTLSTLERAEDVIRNGRTRDEHTVDVMESLLTEHADVDTLVGTADGGDTDAHS
jgi:BioD-like phosphotransacetylase family protein